MQFIALLAGIVLMANESWFNGAGTVGLILTIVGGFFSLITILIFLGVFAIFAKDA